MRSVRLILVSLVISSHQHRKKKMYDIVYLKCVYKYTLSDMYIYIYCIPIYIYIYCESEVITWILSIPLDYVLVKVVDGDAEVSEAACVLF